MCFSENWIDGEFGGGLQSPVKITFCACFPPKEFVGERLFEKFK